MSAGGQPVPFTLQHSDCVDQKELFIITPEAGDTLDKLQDLIAKRYKIPGDRVVVSDIAQYGFEIPVSPVFAYRFRFKNQVRLRFRSRSGGDQVFFPQSFHIRDVREYLATYVHFCPSGWLRLQVERRVLRDVESVSSFPGRHQQIEVVVTPTSRISFSFTYDSRHEFRLRFDGQPTVSDALDRFTAMLGTDRRLFKIMTSRDQVLTEEVILGDERYRVRALSSVVTFAVPTQRIDRSRFVHIDVSPETTVDELKQAVAHAVNPRERMGVYLSFDNREIMETENWAFLETSTDKPIEAVYAREARLLGVENLGMESPPARPRRDDIEEQFRPPSGRSFVRDVQLERPPRSGVSPGAIPRPYNNARFTVHCPDGAKSIQAESELQLREQIPDGRNRTLAAGFRRFRYDTEFGDLPSHLFCFNETIPFDFVVTFTDRPAQAVSMMPMASMSSLTQHPVILRRYPRESLVIWIDGREFSGDEPVYSFALRPRGPSITVSPRWNDYHFVVDSEHFVLSLPVGQRWRRLHSDLRERFVSTANLSLTVEQTEVHSDDWILPPPVFGSQLRFRIGSRALIHQRLPLVVAGSGEMLGAIDFDLNATVGDLHEELRERGTIECVFTQSGCSVLGFDPDRPLRTCPLRLEPIVVHAERYHCQFRALLSPSPPPRFRLFDLADVLA
jgi:hypothetical protein